MHCQNKVQGTHLDHINGLDDAGGTHAGQTTIEEGFHGGPESGFGLACVHGGAESAFLSVHGGHGRSQEQSVRDLQNVSPSTCTLRSRELLRLGGVAKEQFADDRTCNNSQTR